MADILETFAKAHDDLQDHADFHAESVNDKTEAISRLKSEIDDHRASASHALRVQEALTPFLPLFR
jgi:hypothetical protein